MTEELDIVVNNTRYRLSDEFKREVEDLAERFYDGNDFIDLCWRRASADETDSQSGHREGDPLLHIETSGHVVPWENLSEFEVDSGDGIIDGEDVPDIKESMFPEEYRPYPDPDDDDINTWIPEPERYSEDEGPTLVMPAPEDKRAERWETGRSLTKVYTHVEWNLQKRADTSYTVYEEKKQDSHDDWELWLKETGCTPVEDDVSSQQSPANSGTEDPYDVEDMGPKYGKNDGNWRF